MKTHIGTSGWSYTHWKDNFYPSDVKSDQWLHYYSTVFSTVEINNTFYRLPYASTIQNWAAQVPKNFLFSLKASRYITHQKKLHDCQSSLEYFFSLLKDFKQKAGPILFQLPPTFKINEERLKEFIACLSYEYRYVFEFRHASWYVDSIYELLHRSKIALCISDLKGVLTPEEITTDFTYIRMHGPQDTYQGTYGKAALKQWQKKIEKWNAHAAVYCYFDNDEKGYAVQDAKTLLSMLN